MTQQQSKQIGVVCNFQLYEWLKAQAEAQSRSISNQAAHILTQAKNEATK